MYIAITIVLIASFLNSFTHHIDKYLLSITNKYGDFKGLIVFSSLIAGMILSPFFLVANNFHVMIDYKTMLILLISACFFLSATWFYYKGLKISETSAVAVMLQMLPIISFVLSYFLFNASFTLEQVIGSLLIVLSSVLVSFEFGSHKFKLKKIKALVYVFISVVLYATYFLIFDTTLESNSFSVVIFWYQICLLVLGLTLIIIFKSYRKSFFNIVRKNGKKFFMLNIINETLSIVANVLISYSFVFISAAVALSITAFQPLFVFLIGIVGEAFLPKLFYENIKLKSVIFRFICLFIAIFGVILIN